MKTKIVIKSFSALSYDLVVQKSGATERGWPRLASPRRPSTPEGVKDLSVQPERLVVAEPVEAWLALSTALDPLRGEGTDN